MESTWSREQIASGLRLAGSGVPVAEVTQMMGVSLKVFSAWKAEYAELFDKLIGRFPEPKQPNNVTQTVGNRRMAYMSGSVGGEEVESELHACKIRYIGECLTREPRKGLASIWGIQGRAALSGVFSSEIDELRWRADLASGSQIDEAIIRDVAVKFSLDGILDAPIDAIRAFYTSPMDALLLGNFLIKKSDSPSRRA